jgi:hypothetical protein
VAEVTVKVATPEASVRAVVPPGCRVTSVEGKGWLADPRTVAEIVVEPFTGSLFVATDTDPEAGASATANTVPVSCEMFGLEELVAVKVKQPRLTTAGGDVASHLLLVLLNHQSVWLMPVGQLEISTDENELPTLTTTSNGLVAAWANGVAAAGTGAPGAYCAVVTDPTPLAVAVVVTLPIVETADAAPAGVVLAAVFALLAPGGTRGATAIGAPVAPRFAPFTTAAVTVPGVPSGTLVMVRRAIPLTKAHGGTVAWTKSVPTEHVSGAALPSPFAVTVTSSEPEADPGTTVRPGASGAVMGSGTKFTCTVKLADAEPFVAGSVAPHPTAESPIGKGDPDAGEQFTVTGVPSTPETAETKKSTTAEKAPAGAFLVTTLVGTVITGGVPVRTDGEILNVPKKFGSVIEK